MRAAHDLLLAGSRVLLVWTFVASGCRHRTEEPAPPEPVLIGPEDFAVVRRKVLAAGPRLTGELSPVKRSVIRAEVGGTVARVPVEVGQKVEQGRLLGSIDEPSLRTAYSSARTSLAAASRDLASARAELSRTRRLVRSGALPAAELDRAEASAAAVESQLASARSQLAEAKRRLDAATITSPIDGVLSERSVSQGDVVAPGASLFTVIDPSSMQLEAKVPSAELSQVSVGAPVTFEIRGYPDQTFVGQVTQVAPAADPDTRQIVLLVSIPNQDESLVSGLFASGRVQFEQVEMLVVPSSAVSTFGGAAFVARVDQGTVERLPVEVRARDEAGDEVGVQGELDAGDVVLARAAADLKPGTPVRLLRREAAEAGADGAPSIGGGPE